MNPHQFVKTAAITLCCLLFLALGSNKVYAQDYTPLAFVNAGGEAIDTSWEADTELSPSPYLVAGTANIETIRNVPTLDASVPEGIPLAVFETKRIDANQPEPYMGWAFSFPAFTEFQIQLHFIEMSRCAVGSRIFDVEINGEVVLDDLDVFAEAGSQCDVGFTRTFAITSPDGSIDIQFPLVNGKPSTVAGIQVSGINQEAPVYTYAGTGLGEYNGEDIPALSANIIPSDMAVKENGDVLFIDDSTRIRSIDVSTGLVSTLYAYSSEDEEADAYLLALTLDANEDIYFSIIEVLSPTTTVRQVKKIDKLTGEIEVVAGAGANHPPEPPGDEISAHDKYLTLPNALRFDQEGNLFIADEAEVLRVVLSTERIKTVAGGGFDVSSDAIPATDAWLGTVSGIAFDGSGDMYIADSGRNRIRRVDKDTELISTFVGDEGDLNGPGRITFDNEGHLLIADRGNSLIKTVDPDTGVLDSLVDAFWSPYIMGIAVHADRVYYTHNDRQIYYYPYDGAPPPASSLSVSPSFIDFGYVPLRATSSPVQVTLTNEGLSDILIENILSADITPHAFLVTGAPGSIPAGGSAQFDVQFAPGEFLPPPPPFNPTPVFRINAGGELISESDLAWSEDSDTNPSSLLDPGSANIETTSDPITVDASVPEGIPAALFATKRIDANKVDPIMSWDLPVQTGSEYEVNLFFVEMSRCSIGNRIFDVEIDGVLVLDSFDVYEEAGGCDIGIMKSFIITATDDNLDLDFPLKNGKPSVLAGLEVSLIEGDPQTTEEIAGQLTIEHNGTNGPLFVDLLGTTNLEGFTFYPPVPAFSYSKNDLTVHFTDTSTDVEEDIVSWSWDFGDGNTSTEQHPSHTFSAAGEYTVTLTVTDALDLSASTSTTLSVQDPASDEIVVSLPTIQKNAGDTGLIPLTVTDITGENFLSYDFDISYDPAVLEITGVDTTGSITSGGFVVINTTIPGQIIGSWAGISALGGAGTLINLQATYLAPGSTDLTFNSFRFNEGATPVLSIDGSVDVLGSSGTGAFIESAGMVVMEAENAQINLAKNGQAWEAATEIAGFSGETYMASTPDIGEVYNTLELDSSPELQFDVNFTTTGTYYFWLNLAATSKRGNTLHIGLNGEMDDESSTLETDFDGTWSWRTSMYRGNRTSFEVTEPGLHTINVWVREDGILFDKIIFTTDESYTPSGDGPAESPREATAPLSEKVSHDSQFAKGIQEVVPSEFALKSNYPNPFNPTTTIAYEVPEASQVRLDIFDMMGRRVATLINASHSAGRYEIQWNATNDAGERVASGIYLYRMQAGNFEAVDKMVLMK